MGSYRSSELLLIQRLTKKRQTIALAESCTGGALANCLTNISGSSKVFLGGVVVYSNKLKEKLLKVSPTIIRKHGAVSSECAEAMVRGIHRITQADLCVSVTGIAGPTGGTKKKPVGTVYVGVLYQQKCFVRQDFWPLPRKRFKAKVCRVVLNNLLNLIKGAS